MKTLAIISAVSVAAFAIACGGETPEAEVPDEAAASEEPMAEEEAPMDEEVAPAEEEAAPAEEAPAEEGAEEAPAEE